MSEENLWYPISLVAEILALDYARLASKLEHQGQVRVDSATQVPCVSGAYLQRYPEFVEYQKSRRSADLPDLDHFALPLLGDKHADIFSLKDIRPHWAKMMNSELTGPEQLSTLVLFGKWRSCRAGTSRFFRMGDFMWPDSWASPAETSWRNGVQFLEKAVAEKERRFPEAPNPEESVEELEAEDAPEEMLLEGPEAFPWAAPASIPLNVATKEKKSRTKTPAEGGYVKFKFYQDLAQPSSENYQDYLAYIPLPLLKRALARAKAWKECIEENRIGLKRATHAFTDSWFKDHYEQTQRRIYRERKAWTQGFLVPLLPPDFSFLF